MVEWHYRSFTASSEFSLIVITKFSTYRFCHKLNTPWTFLPYIIPTLVQRLGNQEIVEPTEEIRLLHIESLSSLVDICKEHLNLYIEDLIRILERTLVDPFADVKKVCHIYSSKTLYRHAARKIVGIIFFYQFKT